MKRGSETGVVLDGIGAGQDIDRYRFLPGFAGVHHFEARQVLVVFAQQADGSIEDAAPFGATQLPPNQEPFMGGLHRSVYVIGSGVLDCADDFAGGRVDRVEGLATRRVDPPTVDEETLGGQMHEAKR